MEKFRQERPGRPAPDTLYRRETQKRLGISYEIHQEAIDYDKKSDGMYPLLTNDRRLTPAQVLEAHKRQPTIEKHFDQAKTVHEIAPVFLKNEGRIEALFFLYFLALLVQALMEREMRLGMQSQGIEELPKVGIPFIQVALRGAGRRSILPGRARYPPSPRVPGSRHSGSRGAVEPAGERSYRAWAIPMRRRGGRLNWIANLSQGDTHLAELPLYPEDRPCRRPAARRIFQLFSLAQRNLLFDGEGVVQVFVGEGQDQGGSQSPPCRWLPLFRLS